jgi:V8-like Glu-specific endopeptidase
MFVKLTVRSCMALVVAAASLCPSNAIANIFLPDDRQPVLSREYPWRCIGLVLMETKTTRATGTGFLIGRNLVLTNAHCTMDTETGETAENIYFFANRVDGVASNAVHVNHVWRGADDLEEHSDGDWAILRLDSNLGDDLGWLELSAEDVDQAVLTGYSGDYRDQQTAASARCSLYQVLPWLRYHDGDSTSGSSGGPVLAKIDGKLVVVALHFAHKRDKDDSGKSSDKFEKYEAAYANMALPVAVFINAVQAIIEEQNACGLADAAQRARAQISARQYESAIKTLSELIDACPQNSWARLLRGYVLSIMGRTAEAAKDYRDAIELDPRCLDSLLARAVYCKLTKNHQEYRAVTTRWILASSGYRSLPRGRVAANDVPRIEHIVFADSQHANTLPTD